MNSDSSQCVGCLCVAAMDQPGGPQLVLLGLGGLEGVGAVSARLLTTSLVMTAAISAPRKHRTDETLRKPSLFRQKKENKLFSLNIWKLLQIEYFDLFLLWKPSVISTLLFFIGFFSVMWMTLLFYLKLTQTPTSRDYLWLSNILTSLRHIVLQILQDESLSKTQNELVV